MTHEPIINYDELFCLTLKDEHKTIKQLINEELKEVIKQHANDKELGQYIRKHYGEQGRSKR